MDWSYQDGFGMSDYGVTWFNELWKDVEFEMGERYNTHFLGTIWKFRIISMLLNTNHVIIISGALCPEQLR